MRNRPLPALLLPGTPELLYWPRVPLEVNGEVVTPDVLLRLRTGRRVDWAILEVDEGGVVTPESRRREALLALPTLRLTERDIFGANFVDRLVRRLQTLLGLQALGYKGPHGRGILEAPEPPRPGLRPTGTSRELRC